jgi:DNA-binding LytR/AlgR family response regulator
MPRKAGYESLQEMRAVKPGLRAVLVSGYSEKLLEGFGVSLEGITFLPKPFENPDLLSTVRSVLDRS